MTLNIPFLHVDGIIPESLRYQVLSFLPHLRLENLEGKPFIVKTISDCVRSCITDYFYLKEWSQTQSYKDINPTTKIVMQSGRYTITIEDNSF